MDVRFCILLVLVSQLRVTLSVVFSGTITENTTFYYRKLPVSPSKRVTINFSILYLWRSLKDRTPRMGIYTTYPKVNIQTQCSFIRYGQLRNENLHPVLRLGRYRTTTCKLSGSDVVSCKGMVNIQDYIPRNFYLTFGFDCGYGHGIFLLGLRYNISLTEQSNETNNCVNFSVLRHTEECSQFYHETSVPNLVGAETVHDTMKDLKEYKPFRTLLFMDGTCYKHLLETACYTILPKCDKVTEQVIHPCREMCFDLVEGCLNKFKNLFVRVGRKFKYNNNNFYNTSMSATLESNKGICDYLPSINDSIDCFYKPVSCNSPPDGNNGVVILNPTHKNVYDLHDVVQYACVDEAFEIIGNSSITCLYSGEWSHRPPRCRRHNHHLHPLVVVLPVLLIPLIAFIIANILIKVKSKTINVLSRAREFDAFVCYKFDTDNDYVLNVIMQNLEEMCEPPLKLCVHDRDFLPGLHIEDNIKGAITKSNSAIIVMSQAFIDSDWCQEEFAHCYLESMKDPAFQIVMIIMQPVDCLDNLSEYMQNFISTRTYLSKKDPKLFQKIVSYLQWVKLPKDKKSKDPPSFEAGEAYFWKQDEQNDLTDSEIEVEFVPSDPFLFEDNDDEADHYDTEPTLKKQNFQTYRIEADVHHHDH